MLVNVIARKFRIMIFVLATIILVVGIVNAQQKFEIKIGWQPVLYPGFFIAWEKGYFQKNGLEAKYIKFALGPPMLAAFQSGDLDIAVMGMPPLIHGANQGLDIQCFLVDDDASVGCMLIARKDSGIKTAKDLKGKKIGYSFGTTVHPGLLEVLRLNKMKEEDVKLVNMQVTSMLPAFEKGDLDAVYLWAPWSYKAQSLGGKRIFSDSDMGIYTGGIWVVRNAYLKKYPDAIQRFISSYDEGVSYAIKHPDEAIQIGARYTGTAQELMGIHFGEVDFLTMDRQLEGSPISLGRSDNLAASPMVKVLTKYIDFFYEKKVISGKPNAVKMVNPEPMENYLKKKR
jgi:aliphatic sulfonates family ABC transporter substrate-binding protein